jgi:UTP--glucose-1-phosphate uridylyltransferase
MSKTVIKAVIPAAGRGTRLAPLTKHLPKELLPVGGRPMIQYTIEMCVDSGISDLCLITTPNKPLLNQFIAGNWTPPTLPFRRDRRFYAKLAHCNISIVNQIKPMGVADAVSLARDFVGDTPFVCIMPDCLLFSNRTFARQLMDGFEHCRKNIIGAVILQGVDVRRFGNVGKLGTNRLDDRYFSITSLSAKTQEPLTTGFGEKIHKGFGGGIYLPEYFDLVESIRDQARGEVDDVPIHHRLIEKEALMGILLEGNAFDAGHPLGYRAAVHFAGRPDVNYRN